MTSHADTRHAFPSHAEAAPGGIPERPRRSLTHPARTGMLLVSPALALVVLLVVVPLAFAVYISLTDWPLIGAYHFIGLRNYTHLNQDTVFSHSIVYTLVYTGIVTGPILVVGYLMALLVRSNRRGAGLLRTVFFLPYVIGLTTLSFFALVELQPGTGAVNWLLQTLGITNGQTAWLISVVPATGFICVLVVWGVSGLTMLLLLAGMQAIPADVYESAELDGASRIKQELLITVPLLRRTIALSLIISVIGSLLAFNQFFILTQGGPGTSTATVVLWIYEQAFTNLHLGEATTLSIVLVVVIGIISAVQFLALRRDEP
jgi:multiple sugar transport system permease protein